MKKASFILIIYVVYFSFPIKIYANSSQERFVWQKPYSEELTNLQSKVQATPISRYRINDYLTVLMLAERGFDVSAQLSDIVPTIAKKIENDNNPMWSVLAGIYSRIDFNYAKAMQHFISAKNSASLLSTSDRLWLNYQIALTAFRLSDYEKTKSTLKWLQIEFQNSKDKSGLFAVHKLRMELLLKEKNSELILKTFNNAIKYANSDYKKASIDAVYGIHLLTTNKLKTAITYFEAALPDLKQHHPHQYFIALFNNAKGKFSLGDQIGAKSDIESALEYFEFRNDLGNMARMRSVLAIIVQNQGDYETALNLNLKALEEAKKVDSKAIIPRIYNNLAGISYLRQDFETAHEYFTKSLKLSEENNDLRNQINALINLGNVASVTKKHFEAIRFYKQAITIIDNHNFHPPSKIHALNEMARIYVQLERYDKARQTYKTATEILGEHATPNAQFLIFEGYGKLEMTVGRYDEAEKLLLKALAMAERVGRTEYKLSIYLDLANFYEKSKNYQSATQYYIKFVKFNEKVSNERSKQNIAKMQAEFDLKSKQAQIQLLNKENQLKASKIAKANAQQNQMIMLALFAVFIVSVIIHRYFLTKRTNRKLAVINKKLYDISTKDPLTQLNNRRFFKDSFMSDEGDTEVAFFNKADRKKDAALFVLDIDFFKNINDKYGHGAGDAVLIEFAERLASVCRQSDLLVRWGGEEFLILTKNADIATAHDLAYEINSTIRQRDFDTDDNKKIHVSCSIGYCVIPANEDGKFSHDWDLALKVADKAMYRAKVAGRDQALGVQLKNDDICRDCTAENINHIVERAQENLEELCEVPV